MKKFTTLLLLLPLLFITACGDEDEPKSYFNPVEGEWVYTTPLGKTETRVFNRRFQAFVIINDPNNGRILNDTLGVYTIDETALQYKNTGNFHHYTIKGDTLHLEHKASDWSKSFIRTK